MEVTLLSKEEIERKSKVLQKVGRICNRPYWTRTPSHYDSDLYIVYEFCVTSSGLLTINNVLHHYGARPVIKSDNLEELIRNLKKTNEDGIEVVEYGKYPDLETELNIPGNVSLNQTGKIYYYPAKKGLNLDEFDSRDYPEYEYNGQKVVRKGGNYYPVKPVKFYVDRENNMLISKDALFPSPINLDKEDYNGYFETSQLYDFLNNEFIKALKSDKEYKKETSEDNIETLFEEENPYNLDLEDFDEEDIIEGAILSDIPLMLHGKTAAGKSSRIKQMDKDVQIVYLGLADPTDINEENVQKVREFVSKLGPEFLSTFDSMWTIGSEERLEIIASLRMGGKQI